MAKLSVSLDDVQAAAKRLTGHIRQTPLLESSLLNRALGFRLLVKAEGLQHTGAFKIRGAVNNVLQLTEEEKRRGVFAMSAGNHAQGLACAAQKFGVPVTILMPHNAPKMKVENTRAYGAEVIFYHRDKEDREVVGRRIAEDRGLRLIHSYNDPRTIAGQGTIGLEMHRQSRDLGIEPHAIIVNCSGGGLTAGISLSRDLYANPPQIYTAEPERFDDARHSLVTGVLKSNARLSGSICDALLMPKLGDLTFPILQNQKVNGFVASDAEVQAAMSVAADYFKLVAEPGGAVSVATAIQQRERFKGETIIAVLSGSNIASKDYAAHIRAGAANRKRLWKLAL